jgi:hypothetical protein
MQETAETPQELIMCFANDPLKALPARRSARVMIRLWMTLITARSGLVLTSLKASTLQDEDRNTADHRYPPSNSRTTRNNLRLSIYSSRNLGRRTRSLWTPLRRSLASLPLLIWKRSRLSKKSQAMLSLASMRNANRYVLAARTATRRPPG